MTTTPAVYTHGHHESVLRSHRWRTAANSAGYLLARLRRGMSLLDVGCGPGTITADLAERVWPGRVTAVETAPDVLAVARAEAERRSFRIDAVVSDAHLLGLRDQAYDVVHAHQVLQHVADPVRALREMRRVCARGGTVAVRDSDYQAFRWQPDVPELDEWLHVYRTLARDNHGEPDAGRLLTSWVREAGFRDIRASSSRWRFEVAQDREWWGRAWADRVEHSRIADQAVSSGLATRDDLSRIAHGWLRWAAAEDGWMTVPHGEVLARP